MNHQPDIDKIYLYAKYLFETKSKLFIDKSEKENSYKIFQRF